MEEFFFMKLGTVVLKYRAVPVVTGLMTVATAFPALAADTPAADVSEAVAVTTSAMGLLSSYPLNIFVAGGLVVMGFRLFRSGKKASK